MLWQTNKDMGLNCATATSTMAMEFSTMELESRYVNEEQEVEIWSKICCNNFKLINFHSLFTYFISEFVILSVIMAFKECGSIKLKWIESNYLSVAVPHWFFFSYDTRLVHLYPSWCADPTQPSLSSLLHQIMDSMGSMKEKGNEIGKTAETKLKEGGADNLQRH